MNVTHTWHLGARVDVARCGAAENALTKRHVGLVRALSGQVQAWHSDEDDLTQQQSVLHTRSSVRPEIKKIT